MRTSGLCIRLEDFSKDAIGDGSDITMKTLHLCIRLEDFSKDAIGDVQRLQCDIVAFKQDFLYIHHGWKINDRIRSYQTIIMSLKEAAVIQRTIFGLTLAIVFFVTTFSKLYQL